MTNNAENNTPQSMKDKFSVRLFQKGDEKEITELVYENYGYSYNPEKCDPNNPKEILEMNLNNKMFSSIILNNDNNKIVGHICLTKDNEDNSYELMMGMTDPIIKGTMLPIECINILFEKAKEMSADKIFSYAVTSHERAQRILEYYDFKPTALLIGMYQKSLIFKQMDVKKTPQRESFLYMMKKFHPEKKNILTYIPKKHKDFFEHIYGNINLNREIRFPDYIKNNSTPITSVNISIKVNRYWQSAFFTIDYYSPQLIEDLRNKINDVLESGIKYILLLIPTDCPENIGFYEEFENLGFSICGIIPTENQKDLLCLQMLNDSKINFDNMYFSSNASKTILNYVKQNFLNKTSQKSLQLPFKNDIPNYYEFHNFTKLIKNRIFKSERIQDYFGILKLQLNVTDDRHSRLDRIIEKSIKILLKPLLNILRGYDAITYFKRDALLVLFENINGNDLEIIKSRINDKIKLRKDIIVDLDYLVYPSQKELIANLINNHNWRN